MKPRSLCYRAAALFASVLTMFMTVGPAFACVDGISPTEAAFVSTFSCDQNDVITVANDYALTDDSWNAAGLHDDCNAGLPFAKVVNAVAFIGLGPHLQLGGFHDTIDYLNESRSTRSAFHGDFYDRFIQQGNTPNVEADSNTGRFAAEDRTNLHCPIFNMPAAGAISAGLLAERASVLVHEAWHHWNEARFGSDIDHADGPTGYCTASGPSCDFYYYHAPDFRLPDGSISSQLGKLNLLTTGQSQNYFHSPYQVMVEFSADMALFGNPYIIPFAARLEAMKVGNVHLSQNFIEAVPYTIGTPVPFPKIQQRQTP